MATSVGAAAAQGIESGFNLGLRGAAAKADEEERRRRQANEEAERGERATDRADARRRAAVADERAAKQDKRLARADERQAGLDRLKLLDTELGELQTEGTALWSQHGGYDKVPEDMRADYTGRVKSVRQRRAEERRRFYMPDVEEQERDASEKWSRIQANQMSIDDLSDDDLVRTLTVKARRPLADFLRPKEGGASLIEQAALDLEAGMQTGNMDLTLRGANELLKPELSTGVGTEGRDGSEIVSKRIVQLVPHPRDPSRFVPIVEVKVKRDDGAVGTYLAPITEGRSADPTDNVKTISVQDALDRVGQLNTLAAALNRPDMRKRVEKGAEGPGGASANEFLAALGSVGVTPPKPRKVNREYRDQGGYTLEIATDDAGSIVGERKIPKTLAPSRGEGGEKLTAEEKQIMRAQRMGLISPDEAGAALRNKALGLKPGGDEKSTEGERKAATLLTRLRSSQAQLNAVLDKKPDASKPGVMAEMARKVGGDTAANLLNPEARQQVEAAQLDLLDAALTLGTGAAYTREQLMGYRRSYFPQIGDDEGTVKDKQDRLQAVIDAAEIAAGNVAKKVPAFTPGSRKQPAGLGGGSSDDASPLPPAARSALKEGQVTTFGNGQKWTLQGGKPVQVK